METSTSITPTATPTPTPTPTKPAPRHRYRNLLLALATLILSSLAVVSVAPSASASVSCHSLARRHATTNFLGQITHGVTNEVYFCSNKQTNRITHVQVRASHQERYLWNWAGWNGNFTRGGVGYSSFTYYVEGSFRECASFCFHSARNWVKITVNANGSASWSGGSY